MCAGVGLGAPSAVGAEHTAAQGGPTREPQCPQTRGGRGRGGKWKGEEFLPVDGPYPQLFGCFDVLWPLLCDWRPLWEFHSFAACEWSGRIPRSNS